jgi:two-component system KDP operon response regulator KdpE
MARVRSAVRRSQATREDQDQVIATGDIKLDSERRLVRKSGNLVHLTPKAFDLLRCLMLHAGKPQAHVHALTSMGSTEYGNEFEYLCTFVRQLRKKLEDAPSSPEYILTHSCTGYRFKDAESVGD